MSNRKQRRDTKKVMNRPELKAYVDKVCMDFAGILVDHCEKASNEAKEKNVELKFEDVEERVRESMNDMGASLAAKVQEIAKSYASPPDKPRMMQNKAQLKINLR